MNKLTNAEYITVIYEENYLYITKYLVAKCADTNDISDILQNVFMHFSERVARKGQSHFSKPRHYILRIAKDELSRYYNKKGLEIKYNHNNKEDDLNSEIIEEPVDENLLLEELIENKIMSDEVWEIIKQRDILTIKIFTLRFMFDMTLPDIAKELEITLYMVKNKLYRGLSAIRNYVTEEQEGKV